MIVLANDDGKKMVERDDLDSFLDEYARITGTVLTLVSAGERPDFLCEKDGERYGLEVVRAMQDPIVRRDRIVMGRDGQLDGLEAAILVQEAVYKKEEKRTSKGWSHPDATILVVQLIGSDGEEMAQYLDEELMDEMTETGFREIWIADHSQLEPYGTVQLIGVKPTQWRGVHPHKFDGMKPYG